MRVATQSTTPVALVAGRQFTRSGVKNFANPLVHTQSWYVVMRASALKPGAVRAVAMLGRELVVFRSAGGAAYVVDAHCPHLGSHLKLAKVEGESIRCAFHSWCFSKDTPCAANYGSETALRFYPTEERFGLIWVFNGHEPHFELPQLEGSSKRRMLLLPQQRIKCHPHLVLANGFDINHFESVHNVTLAEPPLVSQPTPFSLFTTIKVYPHSGLLRALLGNRKAPIAATFTSIGSSITVATLAAPYACTALFTGKCDISGYCLTQTVLFFDSRHPLRLLQIAALLMFFLKGDRRILDNIRFTPHFTAADEPLRRYAELINQMPCG